MPHRPKSRGCLVALVGVPLLLAVYVLSSGPVARIAVKDGFSGPESAWFTIYRPLKFIADKDVAAERVLHWYLGKCGVWYGPFGNSYVLMPCRPRPMAK